MDHLPAGWYLEDAVRGGLAVTRDVEQHRDTRGFGAMVTQGQRLLLIGGHQIRIRGGPAGDGGIEPRATKAAGLAEFPEVVGGPDPHGRLAVFRTDDMGVILHAILEA
ncbi:MAG: hypothetical protein RL309_628 [Verrucomicrobiota bacterium]